MFQGLSLDDNMTHYILKGDMTSLFLEVKFLSGLAIKVWELK